ncbi:hypothetical protein HY407_00490 [Candidatus Gottesmanbacteria bacterium]|nr:hypothetical protein [Candidatus Gottesmanbacteria bacterium]
MLDANGMIDLTAALSGQMTAFQDSERLVFELEALEAITPDALIQLKEMSDFAGSFGGFSIIVRNANPIVKAQIDASELKNAITFDVTQ